MRRMNKKAVSPLIATVLLIAFAVALGAVVMNWGRSYVESTAAYAEEKSDLQIVCSRDINLRFNDNIQNYLCYNVTGDLENESDVYFIVENAGTIDIEELQVSLIGDAGVHVVELDELNGTLDIGYVYRGNVSWTNGTDDPAGIGSIQEIKIVPSIKVKATGTPVKCAASPLRKTDIVECD